MKITPGASRWQWQALCAVTLLLVACQSDTPAVDADVSDAAQADAEETGSGADAATSDATVSSDADTSGPEPGVGHRRVELAAEGSGRPALTVEIWYPSEASATPTDISAYVVDPAAREAYIDALETAPDACPTETLSARLDAPVAAGRYPLVAFSHCYGCTRFSSATAAEWVARAGFVVVAPDHVGNTLIDTWDGAEPPIDEAWLARRADDLARMLDASLDGDLLPADVRAQIDADRVAVWGHSFGAVTAGRVAGTDARVDALVAMGAPLDSPFLSGVDPSTVSIPTLMIVLGEDHSIQAIGNQVMEQNFASLIGAAWLATMVDGGHWSVSDLCGLIEGFMPCCGDDTRQLDRDATFTYPDPAQSRDRTGALVAAFLGGALEVDPEGYVELERLGSDASWEMASSLD